MNPLHYKIFVTKKRLYIGFWSLFLFRTIHITIAWTFFRQDKFILLKDCRVGYILPKVVCFTGPILTFVITVVIMLVSYTIITYKLTKRNSIFKGASHSDINSKVMRASWYVLCSFLVLYSPSAIVSLVLLLLMQQPYQVYILIAQDVCNLIFF